MTPDETPDPLEVEVDTAVAKTKLSTEHLQRVERYGKDLSYRLPEELRGSFFIKKVKRLLREMINEESSDVIIELLRPVFPWGTGRLVGWVLDKIFPDALLAVLFKLLDGIERVT